MLLVLVWHSSSLAGGLGAAAAVAAVAAANDDDYESMVAELVNKVWYSSCLSKRTAGGRKTTIGLDPLSTGTCTHPAPQPTEKGREREREKSGI